MPKGGSLWLSSRTMDAGTRVVLEITDNGPGIPAEIRDRIFEPFFTTKKTGTGLGLSIAYGILEQHGGTLQVQSPTGGGTTILITLPANSGAED
jgi:signal transduction histidine kinase